MKRLFLLPVFLLCGCTPTVHVSVPKPVVIDVNMKVDVTTRDEGTTTTSKAAPQPAANGNGPAETHTQLMGEVQGLKNSSLIGEGKDGYLAIRTTPTGKLPTGEDYGAYVNRIVSQENEARKAINMQTASKEGVPLSTVETESAERWRNAAFAGEWVQMPDGTWQQKGQK